MIIFSLVSPFLFYHFCLLYQTMKINNKISNFFCNTDRLSLKQRQRHSPGYGWCIEAAAPDMSSFTTTRPALRTRRRIAEKEACSRGGSKATAPSPLTATSSQQEGSKHCCGEQNMKTMSLWSFSSKLCYGHCSYNYVWVLHITFLFTNRFNFVAHEATRG